MGVPLAEIVEAIEVGAGPAKEALESFRMMFRAADEMRGGSGLVVDREVDAPKMIGCDLLTHEDAANLPPASTSQTFANPSALPHRPPVAITSDPAAIGQME